VSDQQCLSRRRPRSERRLGRLLTRSGLLEVREDPRDDLRLLDARDHA